MSPTPQGDIKGNKARGLLSEAADFSKAKRHTNGIRGSLVCRLIIRITKRELCAVIT